MLYSGVAVGSSIGHAIGGFFGGGSSSQQVEAAPVDQPVAQQDNGSYAMNQNYQPPQVCATDVNNFRQCMDQNQGNLTICGWYLDQLKACQAAAGRY
jgi:coiled-coil-helix-coiled-coil-helix domain-containing protein 2